MQNVVYIVMACGFADDSYYVIDSVWTSERLSLRHIRQHVEAIIIACERKRFEDEYGAEIY